MGLSKDFTNQKFGSLTVIRIFGYVQHGRNRVKVWVCRCVCGNELNIDQTTLIKGLVTACKTCRRIPCVICGSIIDNDAFSVKRETCSDKCAIEHLHKRQRKFYYNLVKKEPEYNKRRYAQRVQSDSEYNSKRYQRRKILAEQELK